MSADDRYDALVCARCGKMLGEHFDMKGEKGAGAWCTTDPDSLQHFLRRDAFAPIVPAARSFAPPPGPVDVPRPPADRNDVA